MRAAYAVDPARSRGRLHPEPEHPLRTPFQRDRDRIVHSTAFRRLEHKTQVFVTHVGDHHRTRLTHTLEVAQIARTIARALAVDEDLTEVVALAHDLGHSAFGHAGESALDACLAAHGGFDHNVQTLRLLTRLERRYAEFDGLNPTRETLEGVIQHNGPARDAHPVVRELAAAIGLDLRAWGPIEAQVAAIADDVAYCNHDLDDGLRAQMLALDALRPLPLVGEALVEVEARYPGLERTRLVHETVRRALDRMVRDLLATSRARLERSAPKNVDAVRQEGRALVTFSPAMHDAVVAIKAHLNQALYRHDAVNRMTARAKRVLAELFDAFVRDPSLLPPRWAALAAGPGAPRTYDVVRDYVAGMTDRFALDEHARLAGRDDVRP